MDFKVEYRRWLERVTDKELHSELEAMGEADVEDAFYRNLAFGTGGLRGVIGAGTNRMNAYVVAKASKGLAKYLLKNNVDSDYEDLPLEEEKGRPSVVIGYDSRIKSDMFANVAARVFVANGIKVYLWPVLNPVPTVSFAVRYLHASQGVMITASHNPSKYNGYKVYGPDGCQITSEAAASILSEIEKVDVLDEKLMGIAKDWANSDSVSFSKEISFIDDSVMDAYIEAVKHQSVLFRDEVDRNVSIVYSPLNGTGLKPVTRVLEENGFTNIMVVEEQKAPDGTFPTCPYPNPEIREAMELGLEYCERTGADLMLATDPDADRCGIAVKTATGEYQLLTGNEVGILLLDFICAQRSKHGKMPNHPVIIKTIVTIDMAEKIADYYGVKTINVLTGFKYIGEQIGILEAKGREADYIFGFEESYGYLTGSFVRDKDAVNAAFMICEMFAYYKTRGISLIEKLEEIYANYGYCLNTLHSYEFDGSAGMEKMKAIMGLFHKGLLDIDGMKVVKTEDYSKGFNGLPKSDVLKFFFEDASAGGSVVVRPSGTEPKLKVYVNVTAEDKEKAAKVESLIMEDVERYLK